MNGSWNQNAITWPPPSTCVSLALETQCHQFRPLNGVKTILNILDSVCRAVDAPLVALGLPIRNILDSVCRQVVDTFVALGLPQFYAYYY